MKAEAAVAAKLGLPASHEESSPLPFLVEAAVKFAGQAQLNALAYTQGLAAIINTGGSRVFESSKVLSIRDGEPAVVRTGKAKVIAKNIVVATNVPTFPLIARGAYCLVEYPTTSYIVAGSFKGTLRGMYISPDSNHYSILPVKSVAGNVLLIGGLSQIRGKPGAEKRYQKLAAYAEEHFCINEIKYKWQAWDYIAYDNVPLIGKLYPWSKHLFVATAFKKWGLSNTMVAAMILRDLILGQPNPWAKTFSSLRRGPLLSIPRVALDKLF